MERHVANFIFIQVVTFVFVPVIVFKIVHYHRPVCADIESIVNKIIS